MAILYSYPLGVPARTDLIIGTKMASSDTDDLPTTQNYSIGSVLDMITTQTGAQTFNQVTNVGSGVAGGNTTTNLITFTPIHIKGSFKDSVDSIGTNNQVLSSTGSATKWIDSPSSGVTAVTGTAPIVSSGGNTPVISLANTTVTAGIYTNTNLTVDAQGRITSAASGTGGYTLPAATIGALGGVKIGYTDNAKNYAVELNADSKAFVNVPWTDTDTDTGALSISTAVNSTGTWTTPLAAGTIDGSRNIALTSNVYGGGTKVGYVPTGGTGSLYLKGDGTWASIPTGLQFKDTWSAAGTGGGNPDLTALSPSDGWLYIVDTAGSAAPNGSGVAPNSWNLGDWCVYNGTAWTRVPATNAGVTSFKADSANSSFLTMTPTTASTGAVELDADLSATAVSGSIDSTKFLRGDNKWAVPSYTTDTNTTYSIASADTTVISLTAASPAGAAGAITLAASGAASVSGSSNTITIGATDTNTTYDFLAIETIPTFTLNTATNTGYTTAVNLATTVAPTGGTGMTVDITASNGNVTAVVINKPGSGYAVGDVVTVVQYGSSGDAIITLSGSTGNVNPNLRLIDQVFGFDDVKLTGGNNMTITRTADTGISFVATNTQNEYATSWVDSTNDVILRLTESGAGSGTQDIKIVAGTNITLTPSGTNLTITATNTQNPVQTITGAGTDNTDSGVILSNSGGTVKILGAGSVTAAQDSDTITLTGVNTMGSGFTVEADTNTETTTITQGDTLKLFGGTNVTTVSNPDGKITINSTDEYVGTVTSVALSFPQGTTADPTMTGFVVTNEGSSTALSFEVAPAAAGAGGTAGYYINGLGNPVLFPTIFAGTVTNVACTINGDAYTASVAAPTAAAAITIAPQGDATQYINGAGDLKLLSTLPQGDVTLTGTQTLTNKTLTTPVIDRISPSAGLLQIDGVGSTDGGIKLMCYQGTHGQTLKSQPHSANITNTMLLPPGANSTLVSNVSASALTNKTGSNSQWTNDEGYTTNVGTVTSVTAGTGMTQTGTSTVNPTLNVIAGNGLTANADNIVMSGSYTGTFTATGDLVAYSDEKLKSNVKTLDGSKVYDMHGVSFDKDGKKGSGVIAQELEKVAPELIHDEGKYKAVAYGNISGYLIEAIKDLKAEIEELKKQIK